MRCRGDPDTIGGDLRITIYLEPLTGRARAIGGQRRVGDMRPTRASCGRERFGQADPATRMDDVTDGPTPQLLLRLYGGAVLPYGLVRAYATSAWSP